ncbi:hypothetical protein [Kitasatospora purpeofusca]|uniref:hypothetical protein n=1 Tax=Kitasatospora purpeofusca TaxID=67352 RepID=UPI0036D363C6
MTVVRIAASAALTGFTVSPLPVFTLMDALFARTGCTGPAIIRAGLRRGKQDSWAEWVNPGEVAGERR